MSMAGPVQLVLVLFFYDKRHLGMIPGVWLFIRILELRSLQGLMPFQSILP